MPLSSFVLTNALFIAVLKTFPPFYSSFPQIFSKFISVYFLRSYVQTQSNQTLHKVVLFHPNATDGHVRTLFCACIVISIAAIICSSFVSMAHYRQALFSMTYFSSLVFFCGVCIAHLRHRSNIRIET